MDFLGGKTETTSPSRNVSYHNLVCMFHNICHCIVHKRLDGRIGAYMGVDGAAFGDTILPERQSRL